MNCFLNWKDIHIQGRISRTHFRHFKMNLTSIKKYHLEKEPFYLSNEKKDICDYDPRCIITIGLMFDDIIMGTINRNV